MLLMLNPVTPFSIHTNAAASPAKPRTAQTPRFQGEDPTAPPDISKAGFLARWFTPKPFIPKLKDRTKTLHKALGHLPAIVSRQQNTGNCYFLSGLDALFHHPAGKEILAPMMLHRKHDPETQEISYLLTFPSGEQAWFEANEVGKAKNDLKPVLSIQAVQMIELAWAKIERSARNTRLETPYPNEGAGHTFILIKKGLPENALRTMLGGNPIRLPSIQYTPYTEPLSTDLDVCKCVRGLLEYYISDPDAHYILTANTPTGLPGVEPFESYIYLERPGSTDSERELIPFLRQHSYSIRRIDLEQDRITVADPHHTGKLVYDLTFEEFCQIFRSVSGIQLPKQPPKKRSFKWF